MDERTIPITRPHIDSDDHAAVAAVLDSGFLVQGPQVAAFEDELAESVGARHAVAVSSCTAALEISVRALSIGPGDLVIVAPYSFVASANVVELCGATPVFPDVDADTFNMSAATLRTTLEDLDRAGMSPRVKAVLVVHTFGNPEGIDEVVDTAAERGLPVIEDAACALGAAVGSRSAGTLGRIGCYSFHPRKIITTGEGGALVTDDDSVAEFARVYRNHGQHAVDGAVVVDRPGANLRLTDIQGALGRTQLAKLSQLIASRRQLADRYDAALRPLGFTPQRRSPTAAVQSYVTLTPPGIEAPAMISALRAERIEATIGTNAIPFLAYYARRYARGPSALPALAAVAARAVTLPLYPQMTSTEQDTVIGTLASIVR